jgi:hypothetical protein
MSREIAFEYQNRYVTTEMIFPIVFWLSTVHPLGHSSQHQIFQLQRPGNRKINVI